MGAITVTYVFHSCFAVQTSRCNMVFDYWRDPASAEPRFIDDLDPEKPLYVFVSHHHKDHFNPEIFGWARRFLRVKYVLSRDAVRAGRHFITPGTLYKGPNRVSPDKVAQLEPGGRYADGLVSVEAFGSTDIGCSYMVETDGRRIFHAGDLNAWIWKDESTPEEIAEALGSFNRIIDSIAGRTDAFDVAMFPVDPRLGTDFYEGARIFVRRFRVATFLPMHFTLADLPGMQLDYVAAASRFADYANPGHGQYIALTTSGASWQSEP